MNHVTPTSLRVLRLLSADPMTQYHQREVARRTGVSVGAANQILRSFAASELLSKDKRGKMLFYKANIENPIVRQFKILFTVVDLGALVKQLKLLTDRIILFGSCAEGTDVKESDIDLFILTNGKLEVSRKIGRFKLTRRIAPIILDPPGFATLRREDAALFDRISKGIVLWQAR